MACWPRPMAVLPTVRLIRSGLPHGRGARNTHNLGRRLPVCYPSCGYPAEKPIMPGKSALRPRAGQQIRRLRERTQLRGGAYLIEAAVRVDPFKGWILDQTFPYLALHQLSLYRPLLRRLRIAKPFGESIDEGPDTPSG